MPVTFGILLRYNDDALKGETTTVEEHNKVLRKEGLVWLGKFGQPIQPFILKLCSDKGVNAKLILAKSARKGGSKEPELFIADISAAQNKNPNPALIPNYYRKRIEVDTWLCLNTELRPLKTTESKSWVVVASGQPLLLGLRRCPRSFFTVTRRSEVPKLQLLLEETRRNTPIVRTKKVQNHRASDEIVPDIVEHDDGVDAVDLDSNY